MRKGGRVEDTQDRKCVCNGLLATVGLGQRRDDGAEPAILTSGADLPEVARFLQDGTSAYSAADVVAYLTTAVALEVAMAGSLG